MSFAEYVAHGWKLCALRPGTKRPFGKDWNRKQNALSTADADRARGAGLMHAYSGTMALDIDHFDKADAWLAERGLSLSELMSAPDAVQIASGRAGHGKLLYACSVPMASVKVTEGSVTVLEFRCATAEGLSVQDVLPPSIHPETGRPYRWVYGDELFGDWQNLPELPATLQEAWEALLAPPTPSSPTAPAPSASPAPSAALAELRALLANHDPNADRDQWIRVGAALHYETQGAMEGLALWDEWSRASEKYKGFEDLEKDWRSFRLDKANTITAGFLRQGDVATVDEFDDVTSWIDEDDPWEAVAKERRSKFAPVHVAEVAKRPPPTWLIKELLPEADLVMLYGEPGAGKSFLALDMAFAIATGHEWGEMETAFGAVVWIAAEAAGSIRLRAQAYARQHGMELENANLWVMDHPISLMSEEDAEALGEALVEKAPKLIIIDTLAAASGGANENSGEDMNKVLANCRKLHATTGATVMLVHHSGKDKAKGARGWSGLKAAMQTELCVLYNEGKRLLAVTKQRDAEDGSVWPLTLIPVQLDAETASCFVEVGKCIRQGAFAKPPERLHGVAELVWNTINDLMLVDGGGVMVEELYAAAAGAMPAPPEGKRDNRVGNVKRALSALAAKNYIHMRGDLIFLKKVEVDE